MAYVVTDNCIGCKYTDCVSVCPVDCFREGANMLVIDPDECIDCGVCEPSCPANAIVADTQLGSIQWQALNREYSAQWPRIAAAKDPLPDADTLNGRSGKFNEIFLPQPAHLSTRSQRV